MNNGLEWRIVRSAFRCGEELQSLLKSLKENSSEATYQYYSVGIATAIDALNTQLTDRVLTNRPELRDRIEAELKSHGRII